MREKNETISKSTALRQHFTTPRNQDSIGWCYAFAAADLVSAELGVPVSSLHTSLIYNQTQENILIKNHSDEVQKNNFFEGRAKFRYVYENGSLSAAVRALSAHRLVCPESSLPFDQHQGRTTMQLIYKMEELKETIDANRLSETMVCNELNAILPGFGFNHATNPEIARKLLQNEINSSMERLVETNCRKQIQVPSFRITAIQPGKDYLTQINNLVSQGKPVAVNYDIKDITQSRGRHINIITARRWNNGKCEYKLRNSWGQSCAALNPEFDCNKAEGSFWVSDKWLLEKTTLGSYLHK